MDQTHATYAVIMQQLQVKHSLATDSFTECVIHAEMLHVVCVRHLYNMHMSHTILLSVADVSMGHLLNQSTRFVAA